MNFLFFSAMKGYAMGYEKGQENGGKSKDSKARKYMSFLSLLTSGALLLFLFQRMFPGLRGLGLTNEV